MAIHLMQKNFLIFVKYQYVRENQQKISIQKV